MDINKEIKYYSNGNIKSEVYYREYDIHREDGPAKTEYFKNGKIMLQKYYINGDYHREDGPAIVHYHENGSILYKKYIVNGIIHREDGPAINYYYDSGELGECHYFYNDRHIQEEDGPGTITYFEDNIVREKRFYKLNSENDDYISSSKEYFINGNLKKVSYYNEHGKHNENGAAKIYYKQDKSILEKQYYIDGERIQLIDNVSKVKIAQTKLLKSLLKLKLSLIAGSQENKEELLELLESKLLIIKLTK